MAAVTLTKNGKDLVVSSTKGFVDAVYSKGYRPKTGTVGAAWNTLVDGAPPGPPVTNRPVTLGELQDDDSEAGVALRAALGSWVAGDIDDPQTPIGAAAGAAYGRDRVVVSAVGASRALGLADVGRVLEVDSATDVFLTVPFDTTADAPVGSVIDIARVGAGRVWVQPEGGYNLISNPSVETGSAEFIERNGTIQRLAAAAIFGGFGIRATSTAVGQFFGWFGPSINLADHNLRPGDVVSARANFRSDSAVGGVLTVRFRAGSTVLSEQHSVPVANGAAPVENKVIPAGCTNILLVSSSAASTAIGQNIDSDGLMLVRGPVAPAVYGDGSAAGWAWSGGAHASPSMGPRVRGIGLSLPRNGKMRLRKRAANDWVLDNQLPAEALKVTDSLNVDRDNGQAGILAPSTPRFGLAPTALVANQVYLLRFVPSRTMTITRLGFRVTTASGTDDPVMVGIYDAAATRVVASAALTGLLNSTGTKSATVAATVLTAGSVYYAAIAANSAAALSFAAGIGDGFGAAAPAAEILTKAASYPLPTTLSGLAVADAGPALWVRES